MKLTNKMKIIHERKKCIGCGVCAVLCPESWKMDEDGRASLVKPKMKYDSKTEQGEVVIKKSGCNAKAADSCPVNCIKIFN